MPTRQDPKVLARRLRIFAFVKEYMEAHHDSPSREEIMAGLDLPDSMEGAVSWDLRLLRRADGLPMELRRHAGSAGHARNTRAGIISVDTAFVLQEHADARMRGMVRAPYVET